MFEQAHSQQDCRNKISDYLYHGGDNGVTMRELSKACGRKAQPATKAIGVQSLASLGLWANEDEFKDSITSTPAPLGSCLILPPRRAP